MIDATQSVTSTASTSSASLLASQDSQAGSEDRFLKLLVAQMQNQDPLNPMDNAQVTSQMAQINTVSGIERLNSTLTSLLGGFNSAQPLQAASLLGRDVLAPGSSMILSNGEAQGGAVLTQSVDNLTVTIKDAAGRVLHTSDLGPQTVGNVRFQWDGTTDSGQAAANGIYQFSVSGLVGGQKVSVDPLTVAQVVSVTPGDKGTTLTLGGVGEYSLSQIKEIF
jgi:flagellar basal-body rod modification protein FlgD